jgi:hypothetical protein
MRYLTLYSALVASLSLQAAEFSKLQWGVKNSGDPQTIELDHISNYKVQARPGEDISLPAPFLAPKKIMVAILDTGVDHTHPALKAALHRNESECRAFDKYKLCLAAEKANKDQCDKKWFDLNNPEVDQDHNGYPMDCSGWTVLGDVNKAGIRGSPEFSDDQGHGTHVAGIVAASGGVIGVSQNVEILPVQVLGQKPSEPMKPLSVDITPIEAGKEQYYSSLGDIVARGMNYAINSGAKVINFSLGWPETNDSKYLRDVIAEAQSRGIIIVAAAGNDSTKALLRPCAYPGVICVASHGPDGSLSHFSNYGTGVDLAAPGTNILSTYPLDNRPVRFRNSQGYEYLHGTSQASPFVTGMVAEMLARGIPAAEVYPRLILGSRSVKAKLPLLTGPINDLRPDSSNPESALIEAKYLLGGLADLSQSLKVKPQPFIVPSSKEKQEILWDRKTDQIQMKFKFKNLWQAAQMNEVSLNLQFVKPDPRAIRPMIESFGWEPAGTGWKTLEEKTLVVSLRINDSRVASESQIPSELDLLVALTVNKQTRKLVLESEILVPIGPQTIADAEYEVIPFNLKERISFLNVDEKLDGISRQDYIGKAGEGPNQQYILIKQNSTAANSPYEEVGRLKINVGDEAEILREQVVTRLQNGYALGLLFDRSDKPEGENQDSSLDVYLLDSKFQRKEKLQVTTKTNQLPTKLYWQAQGSKLRPTWAGLGYDPAKKPSIRDDWENPTHDETPEYRLYFFSAEGKLQAIQKFQDYLITDILEPTPEQMRQGKLPVLLAKNLGNENKVSFLNDFATAEVYDGKFHNLKVLRLRSQGNSTEFYRNLLDTRVDKVFSLEPRPEPTLGTFWFGDGSHSAKRVSLLIPGADFSTYDFLDRNLQALRGTVDATLWVRAAFYSSTRAGVFALTNSELQYHDLRSGKVASRGLERYTFWQDYVFTALQFPLVIGDRKSPQVKIPALYNTEGSGIAKGVKIRMPVYDQRSQELIEIISPARLRFRSSKGCRPLEAPIFQEQGTSFDYFCGDKIVRVPLKI